MSRDTPSGAEAARIARRIEAWRRTGDLGALWPDVSPVDLRAAHGRIRTVTAAVLRSPARSDPTAAGSRPSLAVEGERARRALGVAAFQSGMGPLLAWWLREDLVEGSPDARQVLAPHLEHGHRRMEGLREQLVRVVRAMRAEGVDPVVLKGLHTGAEYFPHFGTRPAADIDLLVRTDERRRAARALAASGFTESRRTRFAARSEWDPPGGAGRVRSLELEHADDPWSVDLHTSLDRWYFRGLRRGLGEGWTGRTGHVSMEKDGPWPDPEASSSVPGEPTRPDEAVRDGQAAPPERMVRVLGQPDLTTFLALHASYELVKVRLVRLVELVLVVRRDRERGHLDWSGLEALVEETGTGRFVHPALALAETLAPGTVSPQLLERTGRRVTPRARRVLAAVRASDMAPLSRPSLDAKLMWAQGAWQLVLNLTEVLVPSDEGLDVGLARLHWRRLAALARRRAGWRAGGHEDTMNR